jgi:hypothetical protein
MTVHPAKEVEAELTQRHKAAATTVAGLLVATVLLSIVAYLGVPYFRQQPNPNLNMAVRILGGILGLGAVVWRRNKFSTMRLQDIGALQGATGLLRTLEKTTLQLAFLGAAIAGLGFITTLMTGDETFTYWSGIITLLVLFYSFPTKTSWRKVVLYFADTPQTQPPKDTYKPVDQS